MTRDPERWVPTRVFKTAGFTQGGAVWRNNRHDGAVVLVLRSRPAMDVTITERALAKLTDTARAEQIDLASTVLRIAVVQGGCSGLTYDLGWDTSIRESDSVSDLGAFRVAVDHRSRLYLDGTELDFSDGLEGKGFHFSNPQAARTCACGESFGL